MPHPVEKGTFTVARESRSFRCARAVQDCLYGPGHRTDIDVEKAKASFSGDNKKLAQEDE